MLTSLTSMLPSISMEPNKWRMKGFERRLMMVVLSWRVGKLLKTFEQNQAAQSLENHIPSLRFFLCAHLLTFCSFYFWRMVLRCSFPLFSSTHWNVLFLGLLVCPLKSKHCSRVLIVCKTCSHTLSSINAEVSKLGMALASKVVEADLHPFFVLVPSTSPCCNTYKLPPSL